MQLETDRSETASGHAAAAEHLLDTHAKTIVGRLIDLAENGDLTALRLCLDRISPPLRERPVQFELPPLERPADAVAAIAAITGGLGDGSLSAAEGLELARMVRVFVEILVLAGREERDAEGRIGPPGSPRVMDSGQLHEPHGGEVRLRPAA